MSGLQKHRLVLRKLSGKRNPGEIRCYVTLPKWLWQTHMGFGMTGSIQKAATGPEKLVFIPDDPGFRPENIGQGTINAFLIPEIRNYSLW